MIVEGGLMHRYVKGCLRRRTAAVLAVSLCAFGLPGVAQAMTPNTTLHTISGVLEDGAGLPVPSMSMTFRLVSTSRPLTVTTDAGGRYSAVASAGIYYLNEIAGTAPG